MSTKLKRLGIWIALFLIAISFLIVFPYYRFATNTLKISPIRTLLGIGNVKEFKDKTNILILGIAGDNHDGPNLSDSIIVVQYDFSKNQVVTLGIPRDVWSDTLQDKINSAYAYGEGKKRGGGIILAKAEIEAVIGEPIQYAAVINFDKFKNLVDTLGGVDVQIEKSFTDTEYPVAGKEDDLCDGDEELKCRYETISFQKGLTHMDGETALKFVRSRHSEGEEGSDFARSKRQQLVIAAIKNKTIEVIKKDTATFSLRNTEKLYSAIDKLVQRDMNNNELALIARSIMFKQNFTQHNLYLPREWFEVPDPGEYYGKYVLIPENNSYKILHTRISCLLEKAAQESCTEP